MAATKTTNAIPLRQRPLDFFYFIYFVLHTFVSVLIDSAGVIPAESRPWFQQVVLKIQIEQNKDPLLRDVPSWLWVFLVVELLFQVPVFIVGAWSLKKNAKKIYPLLLVYGVNASITTLACLAELAWHADLTEDERSNLLLIYLPTFLIPLVMGVDMFFRIGKWIAPSDDNDNQDRTIESKKRL
ncbi:transmembrane protein 97 [Lipomyces japonicus]|uniref:transmembrane protein 97 n=1 Tax=Lipomyces japonicus TaxID=56871 RepID=UPI0034CFE39C